LYQD